MPTLIILGASARAAAASAIRAGFTPWTADLFADVDLKAMVPDAVRCPVGQYPHGLLDILKEAPEAPWIYTGALENHPSLIRKMAEVRPLWGNGPNALLVSRSPFFIGELLAKDGLPSLKARHWDGELSSTHRWLQKPLRGAAGNGISFSNERNPSCYFQQFIEGSPMSGVFVRARGEVKLLGITQQLIGTEWLNAPPFRYAGNIGPVEVSDHCREELARIGEVIGEGCDLLGLFGVDFLLAEERPWVVEVNPRYTASIEVLERAGIPCLSEHVLAFDAYLDVPIRKNPIWMSIDNGKGILYANRDLLIPAQGWLDRLPNDDVADIPAGGELIQSGWPILTLMSRHGPIEDCRSELRARARLVQHLLASGAP